MVMTASDYDRARNNYLKNDNGQRTNSSRNGGSPFGDVHDTNQAVDLEYLIRKIEDYRKQGLMNDVKKAANSARGEVREWIESQHPKEAFNGHNLIMDDFNSNTHHQTVLGSFSVVSNVINANLYANYFQRWANTGVHGGDPHIRWWGHKQNAIQEKFVQILDQKLDNLLNNK